MGGGMNILRESGGALASWRCEECWAQGTQRSTTAASLRRDAQAHVLARGHRVTVERTVITTYWPESEADR